MNQVEHSCNSASKIDFNIKKRVIELCRNGEVYRMLDLWFFKRHLNALRNAKDLDAEIEKIEKESAWNYLLRALGRKAYFCKEVQAKLKLRHVSEKTIRWVIAKAQSYGYLDDERELEQAISSGIGRGKGPYRLVMELAFRSDFSREDLERYLADALPEDLCVERGKKLIKRYRLPDERNKAYAFLARRGFSSDIIQKVLQMDN